METDTTLLLCFTVTWFVFGLLSGMMIDIVITSYYLFRNEETELKDIKIF